MKISNKLYKCKKCLKKKQLCDYYVHKTGRQKGKRTNCTCVLCTKKEKQELRDNNPELMKAYREKFLSRQNEDYFEKEKDRKRQWIEDNPETVKRVAKESRARNKAQGAFNRAKYRASQLQRVPSWSTNQDKADIKSIYKMCKKISDKTGVPHHVDHIYPLRGELVSGLHTPSNLRIITAHENISKGNNYEIE